MAMDVAAMVYELTRQLPKEELYGLSAQMRRAAISIPANIAEGYARRTRKEYLQFLSIAAGSQAELKTLLLLADRLYLGNNRGPCHAAVDRISMMLTRLRQALSEPSS
ncbi:MAG: hypothetical protein HONBIEJF_02113 [Fimbriimonadaceae bacterium]|nr:hypothetical protein [Fimbriimonadaceae bacterium]